MQGDIVGILDNAGTLVVEYKYDAWGKPIATTGNLKDTLGRHNPFRYRGYVYDEETGLYYLRSRYYSPEIGRFINADTVLGQVGAICSHNVFAYCVNNPIAAVDRDGQEAMAAAYDLFYTLSAADGPLPLGDALGLFILAGAYVYDKLKVNANSQSAAKSVSTATSASDSTTNPDKKYYLAVAVGTGKPQIVSPAMDIDDVSIALHGITNMKVFFRGLASTYGIALNGRNFAYGVITKEEADAAAAAFCFGDYRLCPQELVGGMLPHYHAVFHHEIHFWFEH